MWATSLTKIPTAATTETPREELRLYPVETGVPDTVTTLMGKGLGCAIGHQSLKGLSFLIDSQQSNVQGDSKVRQNWINIPAVEGWHSDSSGFVCCFWTMPGGAQVCWQAWETIWNWTQVSHILDKCPTLCTIVPTPDSSVLCAAGFNREDQGSGNTIKHPGHLHCWVKQTAYGWCVCSLIWSSEFTYQPRVYRNNKKFSPRQCMF